MSLLDDQNTGPSLEEIVTPTANDLLALTEAAISDVNGVLHFTDDQRQMVEELLKSVAANVGRKQRCPPRASPVRERRAAQNEKPPQNGGFSKSST